MEVKCTICGQDIIKYGKLLSNVIIKRSSVGDSLVFESPIVMAHENCLKNKKEQPKEKVIEEEQKIVEVEKKKELSEPESKPITNAEILKANVPKKRGRKPKKTEAE